jgi:flagellar basal body-associated protein FliL
MKYEVFAMKMSTVWKILAAIAAVAALCVVGVKLYQKFAKKKEEAIDEAEETDAIEAPEAEVEETVGEDNFSEEVMEVALSYDENGEPVYVEEERSGLTDEQKRRKIMFDKITTGILIALLISPIAILLYIFLWFIFR